MDTSSVQYTLRPKDIKKTASLLELSIEELEKFNALRLLNVTYIRSLLMRADFEQLTNGLHYLEKCDNKYRYPEVVKALAREYNISPKAVAAVLHGKNEKIFFCTRCGKRISQQAYRDRSGLCADCYAEELNF